jgi:hypothetical protein
MLIHSLACHPQADRWHKSPWMCLAGGRVSMADASDCINVQLGSALVCVHSSHWDLTHTAHDSFEVSIPYWAAGMEMHEQHLHMCLSHNSFGCKVWDHQVQGSGFHLIQISQVVWSTAGLPFEVLHCPTPASKPTPSATVCIADLICTHSIMNHCSIHTRLRHGAPTDTNENTAHSQG